MSVFGLSGGQGSLNHPLTRSLIRIQHGYRPDKEKEHLVVPTDSANLE